MNQQNCALAAQFVSNTYIQQGAEALATRQRLVKTLLSQRRLPQDGWDEDTILLFIKAGGLLCDTAVRGPGDVGVQHNCIPGLQDCALMDSNNFPNNVGVGEREARVACRLVAQRHYGLAHGIGRSGDVAAEQPKVVHALPMLATLAMLAS